MSVVKTLHKQTADAYRWIHKLVDGIPDENWNITADIIESNINWQVGHLVISIYYHTILVVTGHQKDILEQVALKRYSEFYNYETNPKSAIDSIEPMQMKKDLAIIERKSLETISSLTDLMLKSELVPWKVEHPVAKTKFEALDWNIKHTLWHCGQIAVLKRILGQPYDFNVRKPE